MPRGLREKSYTVLIVEQLIVGRDWSELSLVSDHDEVAGGGREGGHQVTLQDLRGLLHEDNARSDQLQQLPVLGGARDCECEDV